MTTPPVESYVHGHHESVLSSHTWRTVQNSAAYLLPHLAPGVDVLDVGCGPGTITVDFAARVAPGRVIGVDAASEIIDQANVLASGEGVSNAEFAVGDAYDLDFEDDSFDVVHTHQMLQHVAEPVAVLRQFRRVVRPDGVVAAREVDYAGTVIHPVSPGLTLWAEVYQQVHRAGGGEPDAGRRLKAWAREAGFTDIVSTASVWCFSSEADRAWWGGMWAKRVLESAFADRAVEGGFATRHQLQEISDAWSQWAGDVDGWMSMPHGEVLCRG